MLEELAVSILVAGGVISVCNSVKTWSRHQLSGRKEQPDRPDDIRPENKKHHLPGYPMQA